MFPVRLLKICAPTYCPDPRDDLPFHHLFSTSHFAALVPSFVNWSDLAALGQGSRLPWGRSRFANPDSSAIHNDLRRRICYCLCSDASDHCKDGIFLCQIDPGKETEPFAYWLFRCRGGTGGRGRGATNPSPQPPSSPSSGLQMIGRYRPFIQYPLRVSSG